MPTHRHPYRVLIDAAFADVIAFRGVSDRVQDDRPHPDVSDLYDKDFGLKQ